MRVTRSQIDISLVPAQATVPEQTESKAAKPGKRLKPRHLSPLFRRIVVDRFAAFKSSEDVAEDLRIPARTASDVVVEFCLRSLVDLEREIGRLREELRGRRAA